MVHHSRDQEANNVWLLRVLATSDCIRLSGRAADEGPRSTSHPATARDPGDRVDGPVTGPLKQARLTRTAHSQSIAPRGCSVSDLFDLVPDPGEGLIRRRGNAGVTSSQEAPTSVEWLRLEKRRPVGGLSDGLPRSGRWSSRDFQFSRDVRSQLGRVVPARHPVPAGTCRSRETSDPSWDCRSRDMPVPAGTCSSRETPGPSWDCRCRDMPVPAGTSGFAMSGPQRARRSRIGRPLKVRPACGRPAAPSGPGGASGPSWDVSDLPRSGVPPAGR